MALDVEMEPKFIPKLQPHDDLPARPNSTVMPLFPLGATVYTLNTEHTLNIFEPRYRALYNDILFSGSRRFAVCTTHPETGNFSEVAAVFYLKDLQEVSQQTGDAVKYICEHEVIGRVSIKRVLNPKVWSDASSYLKVEVDYIEEVPEEAEEIRPLEERVTAAYRQLVDLQHELQENVKFTKESMDSFNISADGGLWATIGMWQVYQQQRILARQQEMQKEFQDKLLSYLSKENGGPGIPKVININELPPELQLEVKGLQKRMSEDLAPLQVRDNYDLQLMMESKSHSDRLNLIEGMVAKETKRLETKKSLQSLFGSIDS
mmetsp:Transcript_1533/g.2510  ORF Transcript_1533/g.2510 Transcript_1533/m.2510 type:complete len:320 (+) Transcript_1533:2-961(+)